MRKDSARAQAASPVADAIAASAGGVDRRIFDLEPALMEASMLGHLTVHAICNMGFERLQPPLLTQHDASVVYWAVTRLSRMIDEADAVLHSGEEDAST